MGFECEMGALESLAEGADAGPGRNVRVMLESTAEVSSGSSHAVVPMPNNVGWSPIHLVSVKLTAA